VRSGRVWRGQGKYRVRVQVTCAVRCIFCSLCFLPGGCSGSRCAPGSGGTGASTFRMSTVRPNLCGVRPGSELVGSGSELFDLRTERHASDGICDERLQLLWLYRWQWLV
jgi:hypothetical protein